MTGAALELGLSQPMRFTFMVLEVARKGKRLVAFVTMKWLVTRVNIGMFKVDAPHKETLLTGFTCKGVVAGMTPHVNTKCGWVLCGKITKLTK